MGRTEHQVAVEVTGIAATPGRIQDRAREVLDPLQRVLPFQGSAVMLLDPEVRDHTLLAWGGIDAATRAEFQSEETGVVAERSGVARSPAVVRVRQLPMPLDEIGIWRDHLAPAGFGEGLGLGLRTPDGRYLGALVLLFDDPRHAPDAACRALEPLAPMLAHAIDPMRQIAETARIVRDAHAGVVLTRSGDTTPLAGLPGHPLLHPRGAVLITAGRHLDAGAGRTRFLCPYRGADGNLGYVRVTALNCPP
ncbi:hypothetical protein HF519_29470, partial [Pseudonocardia bannensis]